MLKCTCMWKTKNKKYEKDSHDLDYYYEYNYYDGAYMDQMHAEVCSNDLISILPWLLVFLHWVELRVKVLCNGWPRIVVVRVRPILQDEEILVCHP